MKKINISTNKHPFTFALVDNKDYEYINKWKWHYANGYAARVEKGKNRKIYMHRVINKTDNNLLTDHINHNRLDNRRLNLRNCDHKLNTINRGSYYSYSDSRYKGVYRVGNKWCASIKYKNIIKDIGRYDYESIAALSYNMYAKKYYGKNAILNNVEYSDEYYMSVS